MTSISSNTPMESADANRRAALMAEYQEVNNNFRLLTNIRFKLLAFLPVAPATVLAVIAAKGSGAPNQAAEAGMFALGLFGIVVTVGLATYNARNDQIYLWHVDRAASIERELGLPDGSFANRPNAWFEIGSGRRRWHVGHVSSVTAIYASSMTLWLLLCLLSAAQIALGSSTLPTWGNAIAIVVAASLTVAGRAIIRDQKEKRRDAFREHADAAIGYAEDLKQLADLNSRSYTWARFVVACEQLTDRDRHEKQRTEEIELRIDFYGAHNEEELRRYMRPESAGLTTAAQYVALIVDLPPSWLTETPQRRPNTRSRRDITSGDPSRGEPLWYRRHR